MKKALKFDERDNVVIALEATVPGDEISVNVNEAIDYKGKKYPIVSLPDNLLEIIDAGGLVKAMRRRNGLEN